MKGTLRTKQSEVPQRQRQEDIVGKEQKRDSTVPTVGNIKFREVPAPVETSREWDLGPLEDERKLWDKFTIQETWEVRGNRWEEGDRKVSQVTDGIVYYLWYIYYLFTYLNSSKLLKKSQCLFRSSSRSQSVSKEDNLC